jgi:uncharacterized protein
LAALVSAAETPIPPAPTRWVTDTTGFMSADAVRLLDAQLEAYERSSGHQLLVYIGKTTGGVPIEDWAVKAFQAWKVGRKGLDDGLALFIMTDDRRLRIEVGYGLEGQVPDAMASRIINEVIVPRVQAGDRDGAVANGMNAVASVLAGGGLSSDSTRAQHAERGNGRRPLTFGQLVVFGIIGALFLVLLVTNPGLAIYLVASILSGNRDGSYRGGGGGGGFGGGGGRSGGGGASGSW